MRLSARARLALIAILTTLGLLAGPVTTPSMAAPSLSSCPTMSIGDRNDCVRSLQESLNAAGANIWTDGVFGQQTLRAVRNFQWVNGLDPDGIVGPLTKAQLEKYTNQPAPQPAPAPVQQPTGIVIDGGVYDCGPTYWTCSLYLDRPTTKAFARYLEEDGSVEGVQSLACERIAARRHNAVALACDLGMELAHLHVLKTARAAADGNGCLRLRWQQAPPVPINVYNDGGRNCIG